MNLCIVMGKIISEIEFKFIIDSKNKSIVEFEIETLDSNIVKIYGYNEIADYCYRKLSIYDNILIEGIVCQNVKVEIKQITKLINK